MSIFNIILLTLSTIFILGALTFFVVAIIVGHDWAELSEYRNKEEK